MYDETEGGEAAETTIDETTDTSTEGGDSLNADAGDETESVTPDSLAGGGDEAPQKVIGDVPHARFNEVNSEKNDLRKQVSAYQERELLNLQEQARNHPTPSQEPNFDTDTESNLEKWYEQRQGQDRAELYKLKAEFTRSQLRSKNPDYDEMEGKLGETYGKLAQAGFTGEETAQLIIDGLRYRSGAPQQISYAFPQRVRQVINR